MQRNTRKGERTRTTGRSSVASSGFSLGPTVSGSFSFIKKTKNKNNKQTENLLDVVNLAFKLVGFRIIRGTRLQAHLEGISSLGWLRWKSSL